MVVAPCRSSSASTLVGGGKELKAAEGLPAEVNGEFDERADLAGGQWSVSSASFSFCSMFSVSERVSNWCWTNHDPKRRKEGTAAETAGHHLQTTDDVNRAAPQVSRYRRAEKHRTGKSPVPEVEIYYWSCNPWSIIMIAVIEGRAPGTSCCLSLKPSMLLLLLLLSLYYYCCCCCYYVISLAFEKHLGFHDHDRTDENFKK